MKSISVIHPSRGRPEMAMKTIEKWLEHADMDIEYILAVDSEDAHWYIGFLYAHKLYDKVRLLASGSNTAIEAINFAAKEATGDLFLVVSDDFICPKYWCSKLLKHIGDRTDFVAKTRDGLQPTLITLPILDRVYYNRFGYVYFPGYGHMFSDQEMTAIGHMLGRVITLDMTFEHWHYSTGKNKRDAVSLRNDYTWQQGERLFNERLKSNFGIENPVIPYSEIQWR